MPDAQLRVLLVDDHHLFREGLKSLLAARGLAVVGLGANGADAIRLARLLRPDVVLLDLNMPGVDGLQATRLLKAEFPNLPVVILTASEAEADLFEAVKSGAQGYLLKSYDPDTVIALTQAAARGEPALTPQLASRILAEFARLAGSSAPAEPPPALPVELPWAGEPWAEPLTPREHEVLELLVAGAMNKDIAARLTISENTVKYHLKNILQKLHLHNRAQVIAYALRHGLAPPPET